MGRHAQKRIIRKLDLELFLSEVASQPSPQAKLEQYTVSESVAASMLYLAAYTYGDIAGKRLLDLACGTGRLALGAVFLGADCVVGVDVDKSAIKTAVSNAERVGLPGKAQWVNGDIASVEGKFDTVLENPPFGVQSRGADRTFLAKAIEVGDRVYSLHNHPEVDERLLKKLKAGGGIIQVEPSPFLYRFIAKHGGAIDAVYALPMAIGKMFDFHSKARHEFVVDLYVIGKA